MTSQENGMKDLCSGQNNIVSAWRLDRVRRLVQLQLVMSTNVLEWILPVPLDF